MKLRVSLPDEDVAILDEFARSTGLPTRSAATWMRPWPTGSPMLRGEIPLADLNPVRLSTALGQVPADIKA